MKPFPHTIPGLLEMLEAENPPRCMTADETVADHSRYAGRVELIAELRRRLDASIKADTKLPKVL